MIKSVIEFFKKKATYIIKNKIKIYNAPVININEYLNQKIHHFASKMHDNRYILCCWHEMKKFNIAKCDKEDLYLRLLNIF